MRQYSVDDDILINLDQSGISHAVSSKMVHQLIVANSQANAGCINFLRNQRLISKFHVIPWTDALLGSKSTSLPQKCITK